jgi:adenylosuccinate synthase
MSIEIIVGTNWGDEGKGRMVDYLAQDADVVVRFQGGNNAGHTVVNEMGTFKLHLIPSGVFNPATMNVLGPGMVIDLEALDKEISDLQMRINHPINIKVSDRATICFPFNWQEDTWEEERLESSGQSPFGSTKRGIAPAYGDRHLKKAIQVGELLYPERLKDRLYQLVEWKNLIARGIYGKEQGISFEEIWDWANTFGGRIKHLICDTSEFLERAALDNKKILFEAQLGTLRDIYFGVYPYTTSSSALAAFAPIGGGLFGRIPERIIGVMKAFSTCVGEGPFVTEIVEAEVANELRETAFEYGAATGRPRRIGHFDALASRYGAYIQGATEIALTKLDSLSNRSPLFICTHYEFNGKLLENFPINAVVEQCRPIYKEMEGWQEDISAVRCFEELPKAAKEYVIESERLVARPIRYISVGARRECLIDRGTL